MFFFDKTLPDRTRIEALEATVEVMFRRMNEMHHHVHEQNPGGITSRPRKDVRRSRRQHREVVPL